MIKPSLGDDEIVIVSAVIGTGVIIGIIVGILACVFLVGGAAFVVRRRYNAKKDLDKYGHTNPLFEGATVGGTSVIYQSNEAEMAQRAIEEEDDEEEDED